MLSLSFSQKGNHSPEATILPFVDRFPKDTQLYKIITTKPQETAGQEEGGPRG